VGGAAAVRGRERLTRVGRFLAVAALLAACGPREPDKTYALPAGTSMALEVDVRDELVGRGTAWRLEIATRGTFATDGSLRLSIERARLETQVDGGAPTVVATDDDVDARARRTPGDTAKARLLESLHGAAVRIGFDAANGVTSVEGLDRALAAAPGADSNGGLGSMCSDEGWRRGLASAGLCAVPVAVREGGAFVRDVRVRVPGRGETSIRLAGLVGREDSGLPAAHADARMSADAVFEGPAGAAPPALVGAVVVSEATCEATTTYPAGGGLPIKGQFVSTYPFAGGFVERTTTTFTLVRR
jgi:hypothetical protein